MKIKITRHAVLRARERIGWNFYTLSKKANESLTQGLYTMFDDCLRDMFLKSSRYNDSLAYLHEGIVFVFVEDRLVTVYPITGKGAIFN